MTTRWVITEVLAALAAQGLREGGTFTARQLAGWVPALTSAQRISATSRMGRHLHLLTYRITLDEAHERTVVYTVTAQGAEAVAAAAAGHVRMGGHGPRRPQAVRPQDFSARLWSLLRMRRVLDSESAAQTLCDAGDDFARAQNKARQYLRLWALAGAVEVSAKRVNAGGHSRGTKRYVLVADSPTPPPVASRTSANRGSRSA